MVALGSISFQATLAKYLIWGSTQIYIFDCFLAAPTSQSLFWSLKVEEINLIFSFHICRRSSMRSEKLAEENGGGGVVGGGGEEGG